MTKKERNDSEQEQADAAEAIDILRAIRKSMRWTYGTNETEAEQANMQQTIPAGHIIPSDTGAVGRLCKLLDRLEEAKAPEAAAVPYGAGDIGEGRWPEANRKLDSGEIIEITKEFFDYYLGALPPVHMGRWVRLQNGRAVRAEFGFAEGAEQIRAFWSEGPKFYAAQTNQVNY